jgi:hypothetical protein
MNGDQRSEAHGLGFFQETSNRRPTGGLCEHGLWPPQDFTGWPVWLATYFFAFQIYCDFSGYSDIAIGAARSWLFSDEKFTPPYYAKSIREFWLAGTSRCPPGSKISLHPAGRQPGRGVAVVCQSVPFVF